MRCYLRPTSERLDEVSIVAVAAGIESAVNNRCKVFGRPSSLLRDFDNDSVTGEECRDDWSQEVVELDSS